MRFAVIGDGGMLGREMAALLESKKIDFKGFNRDNLDLEQTPQQLVKHLMSADVFINCVAYTAVDKAENEKNIALHTNAVLVEKLANVANILGARFLHVSTDYVFDGNASKPYTIDASTNPQSVYGFSKRVGEQAVLESGSDATIFRTAWLYGKYGTCFPKTVANVLEKNSSIKVVNDQVGQPTWTRDLAELIYEYSMNDEHPKIVHAVSSGQGTWADFAEEIAKSLGREPSVVQGIPTFEYPTPAKRPAWSVLDNTSQGGPVIGNWRERWKIAANDVLGL